MANELDRISTFQRNPRCSVSELQPKLEPSVFGFAFPADSSDMKMLSRFGSSSHLSTAKTSGALPLPYELEAEAVVDGFGLRLLAREGRGQYSDLKLVVIFSL